MLVMVVKAGGLGEWGAGKKCGVEKDEDDEG